MRCMVAFQKFSQLPPNQIRIREITIEDNSVENRRMLLIKEISGDLFTAAASYSLVHCVAADMRMGKGIAIKFRDKFGQLEQLKAQRISPGGVAVLKDKERFVYYLVTKQSSWGKPTYQQLHSSLSAMREHMLQNSITQIAMPRIGCGLDGLEWSKVKELLQEVFYKDGVEINVYIYAPPKAVR